jgi:hypothetical protein
MFKIVDVKSFKWPVPVNVPKDGGGFSTFTFTAEFKAHSQDEIDALLEKLNGDTDEDVLEGILIGWTGVVGPDDETFPYSEANKTTLLNISYVRTALVRAFFEASTGNKAKKGN